MLVIGAGVAGLAAIGTAASLGAIVYAFDVRPEVAEQIESMGAEFVYLDFKDSAGRRRHRRLCRALESGVPREAAAKFRELARDIDIVITTALIPGRACAEAVDRRHGRGDEARLASSSTSRPSRAATAT